MLLTICNGLHEGWTIRLLNDSYTLGRNRDNDLILVDRWISRRHCLFNRVDGVWHLVDLESTHGVRVNGKPLRARQPLQEGDAITLGEVRIEVSYSADAPPLSSKEVVSVQEHPAVLRIESGPQAGFEVRLENQIYSIGRIARNDIVLSDPTISRRHCLIGMSKSDWYVLDLNSRHGVLVNGELIDERQVLHGDESVQVGDIQMALRFVFDPLAGDSAAIRITPRPIVLSVQDGLHEGWELPLVYPSYTLGRSRCNDLILADPSISRIHCLFVYHRGKWSVEDLGSSLGVVVNDEVIDGKQVLREDDRLRIGDVIMVIRNHFSGAEEELPEPEVTGKQRKLASRKLRIIQTLPLDDFESTYTIDRSQVAGLETGHHHLPGSPDRDMEQTIMSDGHPARPHDDHMDTVHVARPFVDAGNQAIPLDNEEYIKTYSMEMPEEFRNLQAYYREHFREDDKDDKES